MDNEELKAMGIEPNRRNNHIKEENTTNTVAKVIKTLAMIMIIIGLIVGFANMSNELFIGLIYIVGSVVSGIFVFALGEIIDLLQRILNK